MKNGGDEQHELGSMCSTLINDTLKMTCLCDNICQVRVNQSEGAKGGKRGCGAACN